MSENGQTTARRFGKVGGVGMDRAAIYRALQTRDARFDGRVFVGVKTTGIYCRPICPARTPKLANIVFYPTAAAAQEAGFRPCLRCRPESSPEFAAWRGTSTTVARALKLIAEGALENSDVDGLAARLGVGERQLRRLFVKHLGASPTAVAQTRRVLFAKQLVHETDMPMADVAMAAGFRSIRRFNATFLALFGKPPSALRHRSPKSARAGITLTLVYAPPYDWEAMLAFFEARAIPGVELVENGCYRRTVELGRARGTITVAKAKGESALRATIDFAAVEHLPSIVGRIRRVFDLSADLSAIRAHLAEDKALEPLVRSRPGLRVPGAWDGFELAVRAVLGQQISVAAARKLAGTLVTAYGTAIDTGIDGLTHTFPRAERLAKVDLGVLGMPRARKTALTSLAIAAARDPALFVGDSAKAIERLRALPGIGEWTAQYIALRALRDPDAFPAADIGLSRAMGRPSAAELLARAESWRPWRAYAAQHLWTSEVVA